MRLDVDYIIIDLVQITYISTQYKLLDIIMMESIYNDLIDIFLLNDLNALRL